MCVSLCPIAVPSFWESVSNLCVDKCPVGEFADNSTMGCVSQCPLSPDYYSYNTTSSSGGVTTVLYGTCVLYCPPGFYRQSPTRECLNKCPGSSYFIDTTTKRWVQLCPDHYYAQLTGQICVANCSSWNQYGLGNLCYSACPNNTNADPTTFNCVQVCPFGYFSQNNICVINCTSGYADPFTKICSSACSPDYYAINLPPRLCVQDCQPQYKYLGNQSCIASCPASANLSLNLYMDNNFYYCTNQCLPTWYADNLTRSCTQACSSALYSDNSTGLCVTQCPQTPDYFGYNLVCYFPCPASTLFA